MGRKKQDKLLVSSFEGVPHHPNPKASVGPWGDNNFLNFVKRWATNSDIKTARINTTNKAVEYRLKKCKETAFGGHDWYALCSDPDHDELYTTFCSHYYHK